MKRAGPLPVLAWPRNFGTVDTDPGYVSRSYPRLGVQPLQGHARLSPLARGNRLQLALKAQAQARSTIEAIALLKNPQPYIRQANIAAST